MCSYNLHGNYSYVWIHNLIYDSTILLCKEVKYKNINKWMIISQSNPLSDFPQCAPLVSFPFHHIFIVCLLFIIGCCIWLCYFGIVCNINANWFLTWYQRFHTRKCVSCWETREMLKSQKWLQWRCGIVKPVNTGRKETDNYDYTIAVLK